jgi:hypothetical protein
MCAFFVYPTGGGARQGEVPGLPQAAHVLDWENRCGAAGLAGGELFNEGGAGGDVTAKTDAPLLEGRFSFQVSEVGEACEAAGGRQQYVRVNSVIDDNHSFVCFSHVRHASFLLY